MVGNYDKTKRIAKNTGLLYIRMIFLMIISLYTSRVILKALGVNDYGIYNVVGGIVSLFSILSQSLSNAVSRFLNFEMGKNNFNRLQSVFSCSSTILLGLSIFVAVVTEIIGVWFLNTKMNIPPDRLSAANWVLQFSIIAFIINLISTPYNAAIIAHEKMSAFAYISIFEGVAKLIISFLVMISPIDKLIFYATLILLVHIAVRIIYGQYCNQRFPECKFRLNFDKSVFREMISYAGWTFIGNSAAILKKQGGNMLLNLFGGVGVNAARGVASQVDWAVISFANNFITAVKPQITQSYASGDYLYMMKLIFYSSKFSFYVMLLMGLPVIVNCNYIMSLWLEEVPDHTVLFVKLTLINVMIESISNPLIIANNATGKIRNYQLCVGGIQLLNIPVSYCLLFLGLMPETVIIVSIGLDIISLFVRIILLRRQIKLPIGDFITNVIMRITIVSIIVLCLLLPFFLNPVQSFVPFLFNCLWCLIVTISTVFLVGCNKQERKASLALIRRMKKQ